MTKNRAKNLDGSAIDEIIRILDGWNGKLTWELFIKSIEERIKVSYTRQALDRHSRIKDAFALVKSRSTVTANPVRKKNLSSTEIVALMERYERLQAENARLKLENDRLLEQFALWAYNAHLRGLTEDWLNAPLPRVDREQTKVKARR